MEAESRPGHLRTTTSIDQLSLSKDEEEEEEESEEEAEEEDVDNQDVISQTITEDVVTPPSSREAPSSASVETATRSTTGQDIDSENRTNESPTGPGPENKEPSNLAQVGTDLEDANKNTDSAPQAAALSPPAGFPSVNVENLSENSAEVVPEKTEIIAALPTASRNTHNTDTAEPTPTVFPTGDLSAHSTEQPATTVADNPSEAVSEPPTATVLVQSAEAPAEQPAESHAAQSTEISVGQPIENPVELPAEDPVTFVPFYPKALEVRWHQNPCPRFLKYIALKRVLSNRPLNHPATSAILVKELVLGLLPTSHFCSLSF